MTMPEPVVFARQEAEENAEADPLYAELMGTYAALGELLYGPEPAADEADDWVADVRALEARLVALAQRIDEEDWQAFAAWLARQAVRSSE